MSEKTTKLYKKLLEIIKNANSFVELINNLKNNNFEFENTSDWINAIQGEKIRAGKFDFDIKGDLQDEAFYNVSLKCSTLMPLENAFPQTTRSNYILINEKLGIVVKFKEDDYWFFQKEFIKKIVGYDVEKLIEKKT